MTTGPDNVLDERMSKAFDSLLAPVRKRISYGVFQKKYLPFLSLKPIEKEVIDRMLQAMSSRTGQPHTTADLHGNLMNEWMEDVGSVFTETEVVDGDGNIVYIVPAFLDGADDIVTNAADLPQLVEQASNQARVLPEMGVKFIRENILPLIRKPVTNLKAIEMWNVIYAHHGLPLFTVKQDGETITPLPESDPKVDSDGAAVVSVFDDFGD